MWPHFVSLIYRSWFNLVSAMGTTTLAVVVGFIGFVFVLAVSLLFKLRKDGWSWSVTVSHFSQNLRDSVIPTIIGTVVLWSVLFGAFVVKTVYDDHQNLTGRLRSVVNEKNDLRDGLNQRDEYIQRLKAISCPTCPVDRRLGPQPSRVIVAPETIHEVLAEVRITGVLVNPSKIPDDYEFMAHSDDSYLQGAAGKAFLHSRAASYKRAEEGEKVITIQKFVLPPNSDLIGRPVSSLANYSLIHIEDSPTSGGVFSELTFVEVTLRVNGSDVFRHTEALSFKMDSEHGLALTIPLKDMKLPQ
jgi:hypothetical protein